jgi:hypothetical protein
VFRLVEIIDGGAVHVVDTEFSLCLMHSTLFRCVLRIGMVPAMEMPRFKLPSFFIIYHPACSLSVTLKSSALS